ncbi:ScbR family autoregulator-binding transcription factor [Streptomyces sp. NPDC001315]|uniref:ScbR family autoregulator-binding transcription factor n=1 Tax=Streptomyces sp. NPDC001315 TaxID=3364562 RepID=UPI003681D1CC
MAKQDRAIRTRRKIMEAAAAVFNRNGYQGTTIVEILKEAGVTKGALYFHFQSKDELAQGILDEQREIVMPPQPLKLQELIDTGQVLAEQLGSEPLIRASVRLTLDQNAQCLDQASAFHGWSASNKRLLDTAKAHGELQPHINTAEIAELMVGSFAGLQLMSQALTDHADLPERLASFQRNLMPSIATPSVLASLDLSAGRGKRILDEMREQEEADD